MSSPSAVPRAQAAAALAEAADDGWLTGTGAPPHPGGVIEPVSPRVSAARDAMLEALRAYGQTMDPIELVAAIAQTLGQMVALLDQRVHTVDAVMDLVLENIAAGNGAMIEQQLGNPRGNA